MMNSLHKSLMILCSAMVLSVGISLPIKADPGENKLNPVYDYQEFTELLSDYLVVDYQIDEIVEDDDCSVKIYNRNNQLVRFGKADDDLVIGLINRSDFLLEINDTKYYRLNK